MLTVSLKHNNFVLFYQRWKYRLRGIYLFIESLYLGQSWTILLPNGKVVKLVTSKRQFCLQFQTIIDAEIGGYWNEHQPQPREVHLDIGAQIGSYTLLAASCGATVVAFEPDVNNQRFLQRNLRANGLACTLVPRGVWNQARTVPWRSQSAISSIPGVGMIPSNYIAGDFVHVDTLDHLVKQLGLKKIDVIKMDIEGAEIEALEGAAEVIRHFRPVLLIEAYHIRDGVTTCDRVIATMVALGIPTDCIKVTPETLIVAKGY